ncbi:hypothetical protein OUZ56_001225 [Daphnia magna]|uniref:Uncharacterized protein n=1 Tax=Daphnia magna TaxID=35525 RepID=A0ABR0A2L2_9CRUS|nr:hypothetical protein OUZ56_001225 [Daphnia magna]
MYKLHTQDNLYSVSEGNGLHGSAFCSPTECRTAITCRILRWSKARSLISCKAAGKAWGVHKCTARPSTFHNRTRAATATAGSSQPVMCAVYCAQQECGGVKGAHYSRCGRCNGTATMIGSNEIRGSFQRRMAAEYGHFQWIERSSPV